MQNFMKFSISRCRLARASRNPRLAGLHLALGAVCHDLLLSVDVRVRCFAFIGLDRISSIFMCHCIRGVQWVQWLWTYATCFTYRGLVKPASGLFCT